MKKLLITPAILTLAACGGSVDAPTTKAAGIGDAGVISVLFMEFPEGTVCTVATPGGSLSTSAIPGKIEYSGDHGSAPVACTAPDGGVYDVDIPSVLDGRFRRAGITAYGTGLIVSTIAGDTLLSMRNDTGVVRR